MSREKPHQDKEASSLHSTRQMLDELDDLMERMLSLPVQEDEEAASPPREIVRMPTVSATLTILEAPAEEEEPKAPPREPGPRTRKAPQEYPNYTTELDPAHRVKEPELEPIPEEAIPPRVTDLPLPTPPSAPPIKPIKVRRRSLASWCLLPFLWTNQGFDRATLYLGERGRWLPRSAGGRNIVGFTGLLLLAVAMAWLLKDWLGWTW